MKKAAAILSLTLVCAGVALAQNPPPESVTVTGAKSREAMRGFVDSIVSPTHFAGKIARWEVPICPYTTGIKPEAAKFITDRVKAVAKEAGAPVSANPACKYNIEIVFTKTPQALLDDMKKNQPELLGYQSSSEDLDRLATFSRPIEARYTTATQDLRGKVEVDSPRTTNTGQGLLVILPCNMMKSGNGGRGLNAVCWKHLSNVRKVDVTGTRLGSGLRSNFYHIVIVVDPRQIAGEELDAVSDYIAMQALTQLGSLDNCQTLPSIVNLMPKGCANRTGRLTDTDMGYLRGLYGMSSGMELVVQKNEIATEMAKAANGP